MKHSSLAKYAAICALLACANPKNRKQYIEALENQVFENNVKLSQRPGQTVEIRDQSGNIKKTPLIDKDGDGIAEGLDLDGDGVIDVNVMKGRHKKETAEKFTLEIDISGDGNTDYYFAVEKTATGYRITLVAAASTGSQQLTILQTSDVITGIDSTGDNVSDDNRLNGKNCTNTGSAPADSTAPSTPGSLTATAAGQTQVNLTWTASTDNTTPTGNLVYEICQSTSAGGCDSFSVTFNSAAGATSYSVTGLSPLTAYYYRIRARDIAANRSATTGEQSATTQSAGTVANPTFAPTAGFFATAQNISFSSTTTGVTFCSTTNGSAPTCNAAGGCQAGTPGASVSVTTTATVKAVACLAGYTASAEVSGTYTIDAVAPTAPPSPSASAAGSDQVQLNWSAASDNTSAAANLVYEICQSTTAGGCDSFSVTYTTGAGATSYLIGSLTPVTTYYYRIRSKDQAGNTGTPTAEQSATTTTTGTVSAPAFSPVAGTYNASQNVTITSATSGALICYTTNGSTPACNATPTCTTGTTYSSAVSIASTATLRAIGCKVSMTNSSVTAGTFTIDTTPPANVTGFTATAGSNQIGLSWTNPGDADFAGTRIQRKTGGYPTDQNDGTTVYEGPATSYTNTSLTAGTQYYYRAFSYDHAGNFAAGVQATATPVNPGTAIWARSTTAGSNGSVYNGIAVDSSNNLYLVGRQDGTSTYTYGTGVSISGPYSTENAIIVKYDASGSAQWVRSVTAGMASVFNDSSVDADGNIYVVGYQTSGSFTYGPGVSITGASTVQNAVIVKYNSSGTAQWARTVSTGTGNSIFNGVTTDPSGNIYAVGYQQGSNSYTYGTGVSVTGASAATNAVIVKYAASGTPLWARSTTAGTPGTALYSVTIDSSDNIYTVGTQNGTTSVTYGASASASGSHAAGSSALLLKYDTAGTAQWARVASGSNTSEFTSVVCDSAGSIVAVGSQWTTGSFTYGTGVSVSGSGTRNSAIVKFDQSGSALWARSVTTGTSESYFYGVGIDSSGNIYATGRLFGTATYTYQTGVTATGLVNGTTAVIVKYSTSGLGQWAATPISGNSDSRFNSVIADNNGGLFAAGSQSGNSAYSFGNSITVTGNSSGDNALLVKFSR